MAASNDILLNSTGNLLIQAGDFVVGISDEQHVQDTIIADKGWYKRNPADGVGVGKYLNSSGQQAKLQKEIKKELQKDGYVVDNPKAIITQDNFLIYPNAEKL